MIVATLASAAAAAPDTIVSLDPIVQAAMPYIASGLGALVTAAIAYAAAAFQKWTGIRIDQAHREALHSAAMTGLNLALARIGAAGGGLTVDVRSEVAAQAIRWMEKSVPGALAHFKMTPDKLADFVEAKLGMIVGASAQPLPKAKPAAP